MSRVYFDVQIGEQEPFRLIFELFWDTAPRTCENFRQLAVGENSTGGSYIGSKFHRIIEDFMVQGGDYENGDGTGGKSIYGDRFEDEDLTIRKHDQPMMLSMANKGPNTNGSQFFITSVPTPHLDGKHCVFGRLVKGADHFVQLEAVEVDDDDRPLKDCIIVNAGELIRKKKQAAEEEEVPVVPLKLIPKSKEEEEEKEKEEEGEEEEEEEEENPYVTGIAPPPEFEAPKHFLDRGDSRTKNWKTYNREKNQTDDAGRKVKGRGAMVSFVYWEPINLQHFHRNTEEEGQVHSREVMVEETTEIKETTIETEAAVEEKKKKERPGHAPILALLGDKGHSLAFHAVQDFSLAVW